MTASSSERKATDSLPVAFLPQMAIETTAHKNPAVREYLEFRPVFRPDCTAQGTLSFAVFTAWADEPEKREETKQRALTSATTALAGLVERVVTVAEFTKISGEWNGIPT